MNLEGQRALIQSLGFSEATTALLRGRLLQRRVDTKFILGSGALSRVLSSLTDHYGILQAGGEPVAQYRTLYFDTQEYFFLREHHRGRRPRFKVRIRHYPDRQVSFLEVKQKTNKGITVKERTPIPYGEESLSEESLSEESLSEENRSFVDAHSPIAFDTLVPGLRTAFGRITLVGLQTPERATFDLQLQFEGNKGTAEIPGAVIAEVKQPRYMPRSPVMLALRREGFRPTRVSKYCTAASLLVPEIPLQRFRPTLRSLEAASHD